MKRLASALLLVFAASAFGQAAHKASGVVTKIDPDKGKVTIQHGPVADLKWPPMTMAFAVKDKAVLDRLKKDQKVDFEFVRQGKDYVLTSVK